MARASILVEGNILDNITSRTRHLRAASVRPNTIETYTDSARQLAEYLASKGMPTDVAAIHREHVESRLVSARCTRISFATPLPTRGYLGAALRET